MTAEERNQRLAKARLRNARNRIFGLRQSPKFKKLPDIRKIREATGMTQGEFGKEFGVGWKTISNWERGQTNPANMYIEIMVRAEIGEEK